MRAPLVKSVMTPFPYSVAFDAPIEAAQTMMREHGVRHLPVTRDGELHGIVTDRDMRRLLGSTLQRATADRLAEGLTVGDVCVDDCYRVELNTPLAVVLHAMADRHIGAALVTTHGRLAGIFTTTDACRTFAAHLDRQFGGPSDGPVDAA
ncbi:MAG: CBS domain-containing protein [Pseudomonadales bacterium]